MAKLDSMAKNRNTSENEATEPIEYFTLNISRKQASSGLSAT